MSNLDGVVLPEGDNTGLTGHRTSLSPDQSALVEPDRVLWIAVRAAAIQAAGGLNVVRGAALQIASAIEQRYNIGKKGGK